MRVLIACDIATGGGGNPYTLQLLHALEKNSQVDAVQHGTSWFHVSGVAFDVIHIQWPEALFGFHEPSMSQLSDLDSTLNRLKKKGASLVTTVHNEYPHGEDTKIFKNLYRVVYEKSDGLIHLGEVSKKVVKKRYKKEVSNSIEMVIPHGNYNYYPDNISITEAREELSLPASKPVMLAFGSLRDLDEVRLLRRGFTRTQVEGGCLVIASQLPNRSLRDWGHVPVRLPFWLNPQIQLHESHVPVDKVQVYLNAADVIILPRIDSLNSGIVPLGWTFGTVVVGPSTGVIGEMLRDQDCPTFEAPTARALAEAVQEGLQQSREGKGEKLQNYANHHLWWGKLAEKHTEIYKKVV